MTHILPVTLTTVPVVAEPPWLQKGNHIWRSASGEEVGRSQCRENQKQQLAMSCFPLPSALRLGSPPLCAWAPGNTRKIGEGPGEERPGTAETCCPLCPGPPGSLSLRRPGHDRPADIRALACSWTRLSVQVAHIGRWPRLSLFTVGRGGPGSSPQELGLAGGKASPPSSVLEPRGAP